MGFTFPFLFFSSYYALAGSGENRNVAGVFWSFSRYGRFYLAADVRSPGGNILFICSIVCLLAGRAAESVPVGLLLGPVRFAIPPAVPCPFTNHRYSLFRSVRSAD